MIRKRRNNSILTWIKDWRKDKENYLKPYNKLGSINYEIFVA